MFAIRWNVLHCPSCGQPASSDGRYCRFCGKTVDPQATRTIAAPTPSRGGTSAAAAERFPAGSVLAERYRIISLAGRGGMGEVYRAVDLKLSQPVALKFLPPTVSHEQAALDRLHSEVRLSRQVSHPNVCRVYDVSEVDGQTFLSMEYIDGEDLASLLRRIGRVPVDKGIEIARKLCAGLAAAHTRGVLHRDLKPSNILIDATGQVLITDFGLATALYSEEASLYAGTPGYMAPEQLAGAQATIQTDLYSLGLVLYELFTGKRVFDADSMAELRSMHERLPANPSSIVPEIDAATERAILWCLEQNPKHRPPSALAVAAALPGGDPLAAAIAAGDTPSPELVAAAGGKTRMGSASSAVLFFAIVAMLAAAAVINPRATIAGTSNMEFEPAVLAQKGREIAADFGYPDKPLDRAYAFAYSRVYLQAREHGVASARWVSMYLRYREAPVYLQAHRFFPDGMVVGWAAGYDPNRFRSGSIDMNLDTQGNLLAFDAVPPEVDPPGAAPQPIDWDRIVRRAGLNPEHLRSVPPLRNPPAPFDTRVAWLADDPHRSNTTIRIEAAAWRGRIVHFNLIPPWSPPPRMAPFTSTGAQQIQMVSQWLLSVAVILGGVLLARRHLNAGRGDVRGATRLASVIFGLEMGAFLLAAHHVPTVHEINLFTMAVAWGLLKAAAIWVVYLALEPFVRRFWPEILISWTRVLSGRIVDGRVGRDTLIGLGLGTVIFLLREAGILWDMRTGGLPSRHVVLESLLGGPYVTAVLMSLVSTAILFTFMQFLAVFLLKLLVKNQYLAAGLFTLIVVPIAASTAHAPVMTAVITAGGIALYLAGLLRFGLLTALVSTTANMLLHTFPLTPKVSAWYFSISAVPLMALVTLALFAWRTARRSLVT